MRGSATRGIATRSVAPLLVCLAVGVASGQELLQEYRVGTARIDVTPDYPVRLNGFGSRRDESSGVAQRIWAKALAISHGDAHPVVLVALDNLGIREPMVEQVAAQLRERYGLPRENLAITFTHTHCAPKVNGASNTIFSTAIPAEHQVHIDRYTQELTEALVRVTCEAIEQRQPATLHWGVGKVGFAANRRTPGGPVDHDLPTLIVRDLQGGIRAVWATYACHCVTLSFNEISGDWAGYAQEHLERQFPDSLALISIGCGSDSNPDPRGNGSDVELASRQGLEVAREVQRLIESPSRPIRGAISAQLSHIDLPLEEPPTREALEQLQRAGGPAGFNAEAQLARLDRGEELLRAIHYPIQSVTWGEDLHCVLLGGEVCVDYALALKQQLDRQRLWLHGYSNDFCSYIPSERLVREGGYGGGGEVVYFDLPGTLRPGLEQTILQEVLRQTPEAFRVPAGTQGIAPQTPEDSLLRMVTDPRFRVELAAAEPLVADPVAIDFGPDGRLWVVQMPDYSRGMQEDFQPSGVVRVLSDADRDGRFDSASDFLDGLRFPTDVKVWRDGILVCDAPNILFAADRDGDGKAEVREIVVSGFATHNPHARVNSLRWGLDGWLYGSGGLFGGELQLASGPVVDARNRDFRFDLGRGRLEAVTGATQQGRTRDDWDQWFGCTNSALLLHYPVVEEYARRNPNVAPPDTIVSVPSAAHGQRLFPPPELVLFKLSGAPGRPTSACGAEIYRDSWLGDDVYGDAFVCEPVHQLVHRMKVRQVGGTFAGERAVDELDREFLTSTDRWFRPVQARTGPDGAVWVVDMYRYVIEHAQWIPPETTAELNLMAGQGMGRIYRVVPNDSASSALPRPGELPDRDLARRMNSTNGTLRDMVQRLLVERSAIDQRETLLEVVKQGVTPAAQVQAAATLAELGRLEVADFDSFWENPRPEVRRLAVRLGEKLGAQVPAIWDRILKLREDPDLHVRIQVAYSLGNSPGAPASLGLSSLAAGESVDPYLRFALLSSLNSQNALAVWTEFARQSPPEQRADWANDLLSAVAASCPDSDLSGLLAALWTESPANASPGWRPLAAVLDATERRGIEATQELVASEKRGLQTAFAAALHQLRDDSASDESRVDAIQLLARGKGTPTQQLVIAGAAETPELLAELVAPRWSLPIQQAAWTALVRWRPDDLTSVMAPRWGELTPQMKVQVVSALLTEARWTQQLLSSQTGVAVSAADFDSSQRQRLLEHADESIRQRAAELFGQHVAGEALIEQYRVALDRPGDAIRGRQVFAKVCSGCHVLDGAGTEVGPDLAALTNRTPAALLVAILDPNRDVDSRYLGYTALQTDGKTSSGLLVDENASSIVLREQGGKEHVILRRDLDELHSTRKSTMPEGMERDLTVESLADLIAYVAPPRTPPKTFAGNAPDVCHPNRDGAWTLSAKQAEIYGESIIYESGSPFENIGYWHGAGDYAGWRLEVPQAGRYRVSLDYSCAPDSAGNRFRVDGLEPPLDGIVPSTGDWATYQSLLAGEAELAAGAQYLVVRYGGAQAAPALMDLRAVRLEPVPPEN